MGSDNTSFKDKMINFDIKKKPWFSILLHSDSFLNSSEISTFIELNYTEYVEIDVTPTDNIELIEFYKKNNIEIPVYDRNHGFIVMKYKNGVQKASSFYSNKDDYLLKCSSSLTIEDIIFSSSYDYFVTNLTDSYFKKRKIKNAYSLEDVKNDIRIIFSNNKIFLYRHNYKINEGYYYLMRFKKLFSCYQEPWEIIVSSRNENELIFKNMASLSTRLTFICMAYEKAAYFTKLKINHDTFDYTLYHLGFFIMLCTGAFDDLAWMINNIHDLSLHKLQIVLKKNKFKNKVKSKNEKLYDLLNDKYFVTILESFYPIRDSLQHRNFLSGYTLHSGSEISHMIYLDSESASSIDQQYLKKHNHANDEVISIAPKDLLEIMNYRVVTIINSVYECIDWNQYKDKLTNENKEKVRVSTEKFKKGVGHFFNFTGDPMYI